MKPIRICIFARERLVIEALSLTVSNQLGLELLASSTLDVAQLPATPDVDVVIVDASNDIVGGLEMVTAVASKPESVRILVIGLEEDHVLRFIQAGAVGYVMKTASQTDLFRAIENVYHGTSECPPRLVAAVLAKLRALVKVRSEPSVSVDQMLSMREREVITLVAQGLSNKEIAHHLGISVFTVKNHVHNMLHKTKCPRRSDLMHYARPGMTLP